MKRLGSLVSVGLIYLICELYIDEEFVNNVRQVFARFRKHKIIVNSMKTQLGLDEVEFVGHLVSHEGISFTKEKIMNFEHEWPSPFTPKHGGTIR